MKISHLKIIGQPRHRETKAEKMDKSRGYF